ncbi:PREDICTED: cyclic [Prunus dulcis]|uniref:PREDICTED: cyclic n=1 Tax=Prunus dulcis TaxID=3755 RepID=A0A5E4F4B8_PRUDU|nr:PREDICTED: cyclic [Prunus dulcis]
MGSTRATSSFLTYYIAELMIWTKDLWIFDLEYHPDEGSDEDSNSEKRKEEGPIRRIFFPPLTGKRILMLLCVAVSIDPLFFYIPVINNEKKCLAIDKNLRAAALSLRALPDAAFALHSISSGFRLYPFVELHFVLVFVYSVAIILFAVFLMLPIPQEQGRKEGQEWPSDPIAARKADVDV